MIWKIITLTSFPVSYLCFLAADISRQYPDNKILQIYIIYMIGLISSFAVLHKSLKISLVGLIIYFFSAFFIFNIVQPELSILLPLVFGSMISIGQKTKAHTGLLFATAFYILLSKILKEHLVWGINIKAISPYKMFSLILWGTMLIAIFYITRKKENKLIQMTEESILLNNAFKKLTEANIAFQNNAIFAREEASEAERKRIAAEIHDTVGYTLTNIIMLIQAAQYGGAEAEETAAILEKARRHAETGLEEARKTLSLLYRKENKRPHGPRLFLQLAKTFSDITGVKVDIDFGNMPAKLPKDIEKIIYRLLQESFTNSFRHGKASKIFVSFWKDKCSLVVFVRDNGLGIKASGQEHQPGIGLKGLSERIITIGGDLSVMPLKTGFSISATIPINQNGEQHEK